MTPIAPPQDVGIDDEIVVRTTLRQILRNRNIGALSTRIEFFNHGAEVGIAWFSAIRMTTEEFSLAEATFNLSE